MTKKTRAPRPDWYKEWLEKQGSPEQIVDLKKRLEKAAKKGKPMNRYVCDFFFKFVEKSFFTNYPEATFYTTACTQELVTEGFIKAQQLVGPPPPPE